MSERTGADAHDLRRRVAALTPERQARLAARLGVGAGGPADRPGERLADGAGERLVAYVVARDDEPPGPQELRGFLEERLPGPLVPAAFVFLTELPRTPNGKLDVPRLPPPGVVTTDLAGSFVEPRGEAEQALARIWSEVLGAARVGAHDNFFEIGGDSILSIQVVARCARAGLKITPDQLFEHQTVAELARVVGREPVARPEQATVEGEVPLTPIQCWFFEQPLPEPHHWHQHLWLDVPDDLPAELLEEAARRVVEHHDALRLGFLRGAAGWRQQHDPAGTPVRLARENLSGLSETEQDDALRRRTDELADATDLAHPPLVALCLAELGEGRGNRLLVAIHHLAVDPVSWTILLEDLETACAQLQAGEVVRLPPKTSSFKAWAEALSKHASSREIDDQRAHWRRLPREVPSLPTDHAGSFTEDSAARVTVRLPAAQTDALLHRVPTAYGTRTEEVLLAALALGLTDWLHSERVLLGLERHGREAIGGGMDLSRTVGWFTSYFPLWLDVPSERRPGSVLRSIKEQVRGVPGRGLGYGILRYLGADADTRAALAAAPQPQVIVSYAGRTEREADATARLRPRGVAAASRSGRNRRGHLVEIGAFFEAESLRIDWSYSSNVHARETIARAAEGSLDRLRELIDHCLSDDAGGYTPSDFPEAGLSQEELDRLLGDIAP